MRYQEIVESEQSAFNNNKLFNEILADLKACSWANSLFLFGSVASGKEFPGDIDVVVDLSLTYYTIDIENDIWEAYDLRKLQPLLQILRKYPNGALDIFVKFKDTMLVRNAASTGFTKAKNAKTLWRSMQDTMIPINEAPMLRE